MAIVMKNQDKSMIDPVIAPLVEAFNQCGLVTIASCQGHGWPVDHQKPYVAFRATPAQAALLERLLREDIESASPQLNWGWMIEGWFNRHDELCFSLHLCWSTRPWHRYRRATIVQDFHTLRDTVLSAFKSATQG
ncbi:hypothetical protein [Providencia stuartii]|uniref:hypothetical protein n=1 Tax=Providencia stuartii TaxID=588 RepID=UPI001F284D0F|nr:hypothetical protein [Providencia stuartii]